MLKHNNMKRLLITIALAFVAVAAFSQNKLLRPRIEIAELENAVTIDAIEMEVFYMNDEDPRMYYLSLGHIGVGTDIVQIDFDPVFELFVPLGGTIKEAIAKNDIGLINTAKEELQKAVYEVSAKLYQQAAPQQGNPAQGAPDMGGQQAQQGNNNNGGDPNVYDADFTDAD